MGSNGLKDALRTAVKSARSVLPQAEWDLEDARRNAHLLAELADEPLSLAAYASRPGEPGTAALLESLRAAGHDVLLPVLRRSPAWAHYTGPGDMAVGPLGIPQPTSTRLGPDVLRSVDLVLVPCLAVSVTGVRLGTGGGWYDRALPLRRDGVPVWALARAAEVLDALPAEPHDIPVDAVVTEEGVKPLG